MFVWKVVLGTIATVGSLHAVVQLNSATIDRYAMRFFRDLGRYMARKRRFGAHHSKGLVATLMHTDGDPLDDLKLMEQDESAADAANLPTYTLGELYEYGSEDEKLLISIFGRVYDVTKGKRFYGSTGTYASFAGRDVTYSLCTGCRTDECLDEKTVEDVPNDNMLSEGKRWLSFFHLHDKYPLVGKLETDHLEELMKELVEKELQKAEEENAKDGSGGDKPLMPPIPEM